MTEEAKNQLPDSIITASERHRRIREESALREAEAALREKARIEQSTRNDTKARDQEAQFLERIALISSEETIEHLHERIRALREPPPDPEKNRPPPYLTERQAAQIAAEQEGGRLASERAKLREEANRAAAARMEAEQRIKEGHNDPIVIPNPLMTDVYPAVKATLK
jgi:hypothetical protein